MPTTRRKSKLLKYLPKAASAVSFQNPKQRNYYSTSGFSGPIVSIIPDEARRRRRGDDDGGIGSTQEPSSPKVSCIGQIKKKKKKKTQDNHHKRDEQHDHKKKEESKIFKMFRFGSRKGNNNKKGLGEGSGSSQSGPAPNLGHMKRFTSGRQSLANFDWTAQIAPVNDVDDRNYHSDEEFGRYSDSEEEDEVIIPFSAPILMGGDGFTEARKEVNLWQRRNTASPLPLQVKPIKIRAD